MKVIKYEGEEIAEADGVCDWKDTPDEVLKTVDNALKVYGLEIQMIDQDGDAYLFNIVKRSEA